MRKIYVVFIVGVLFSFFFGYVAAQDWQNSNKQGTLPVIQDRVRC